MSLIDTDFLKFTIREKLAQAKILPFGDPKRTKLENETLALFKLIQEQEGSHVRNQA